MKAGSFYQNYREIRLLVIHCSATRCDRSFPVEALRRAHLHRGFASISYHFYITRDGEVHPCRPVHQIGAHATGWNDKSIGICYEGGLDEDGHPADTRTYAQRCSLLDRKPPVIHVFSATLSISIFVPKNEIYDDTRRSCRNYYVLQGTQSNL